MISKFLSKLKSILFSSKAPSEIPEVKPTKLKAKKKLSKTSKISKSKTKKEDPKKLIEALKAIPGVGAKSAEAFYKAGFKTPKLIASAKDEDLLAVPGVGINLVKKLKNLK
tara:strand:- start:284 stop:616 length:333 start_codon:yes stop_codon:yes gene_type:complete